MGKLVTALIFATLAGSLTFGAAAALNVNAQNLGSGGADVTACQDSIAVGFRPVADAPDLIDAVTVAGIGEACDGQTISFAVLSAPEGQSESTVLASGSGELDASQGDQAFEFDEVDTVIATDIDEIGVTVAGLADLG
ncbi:MAG: hypothetical protein AAF962_09020 [Actinomycetota bacterium]